MKPNYEAYAKIRDQNNLTDYAVSNASGVAKSTLSEWKYGKHSPQLENVGKLAKYFNVPIEYFVEDGT